MDLDARYTTACVRTVRSLVWCWGENTTGKMGAGLPESPARIAVAQLVRKRPRIESRLGGITQMSVGKTHSCARHEFGEAACWGANTFGNPKVEDPSKGFAALAITIEQRALAEVAAGFHHTCGILGDTSLWCWGEADGGKLGTGGGGGRRQPRPVRLDNGESFADVTDISLGRHHTCALTRKGGLYCWGENSFGQLGRVDLAEAPFPTPVGPFAPDAASKTVKAVRAGESHTCALTATGKVWCFGDNTFGQLGAAVEIKASARPLLVVTGPGGPALDGVTDLVVADQANCARREDGTFWCWGRNHGNQLGLPDLRDRNVAVRTEAPCP
jgi:alpha-tubulin suppressor-like RCC1 family protein